MAKKWSEVVQNPEFQKLAPTDQEQARTDYFNDVVAPQIVNPSDVIQAKMEFDSSTKGSIGQTQSAPTQSAPTQSAPTQSAQPNTPTQPAAPAQPAQPTQPAGGFMEHLQQLQSADDAQGMTAAKKAIGLARAIGQGATFGYGDEAEAGLRSILNPSKSYDDHLNSIHNDQAEFAQKESLANTVGEIGGSLMSPLGAAGMALKATKGLKAAGTALGLGEKAAGTIGDIGGTVLSNAGQSALYGSGTANGDLSSRLQGAAEGGLMGGLVGAPLAAAGKAGSFIANSLADNPIATTVGETLGLHGIGQTVRSVEDQLSKTFLGTGVRNAQRATMEKARSQLEALAPEQSFEQIGNNLSQSGRQVLQGAKDDVDQAYQTMRDKIGGDETALPAATTNISNQLDTMLASKSISPQQANALQKIKDTIGSRDYNIAGLQQVKQDIGNALNTDTGALSHQQKGQLYDAIKNDKYEAIGNAGGQDAVDAIKAADQKYQDQLHMLSTKDALTGKTEDTALGHIVDAEKASKLTQEMVKGASATKGGNVQLLNDTISALPADDAAKFTDAIARAKLLDPSKSLNDISGGALAKSWESMSDEAKNILYQSNAPAIEKTMEVMKKVQNRNLIPSGTPSGAFNMDTLKALGAGAAGLATAEGASNSQNDTTAALGKAGLGVGIGGAGAVGLTALALSNPKLLSKVLQSAGGASRLMPYISGQAAQYNQGAK